ncbi:hypothetical protein [Oceanobacillus neutriphilus]|uniref:Uncharacterized protein n=1 Tax=Oceanobacillus neutriphilus TaxID=531815 RepID=A0ABQ2P120_9BACI|nr:hypothetical protein [Oceanobacillus neutriphilus]GGP15574.1 hypothetical protein GCM10011346_44090 [Oceanobacillus neutriphilus]
MNCDKELINHHINVLFKHDSKDRMTVVNEPPYRPAPKVFIGSTKEGTVVKVCRHTACFSYNRIGKDFAKEY